MTAPKTTHVLYLSELDGRGAFSGAENHVWMLLPALARAGVDVDLVAVLWQGPASTELRGRLDELQRAGVGVTEVVRRAPRVGRLASLWAWGGLVRALRRRRDRVIHLHLELAWTPFLARMAGCRHVVASIHNDEPSYARERVRRRLRQADGIVRHYVAITNHVASHFSECTGIAKEKITTVYYGLEKIGPEAIERCTFGIPGDRFVVGFVGRLVEQKNAHLFVEAISGREDMFGVVVGDGPLRHLLEANSGTNVKFLGEVPQAKSVMRAFDLLCLPSAWEGLGLVLVEAMLRGVPVCGSTRGAIPEVLGDGEFGLLFEPTALGLSESLETAFQEREALRERADRAMAYAARRFCLESMVMGTIAIYDRVLAEVRS